MDFFGYFKEVGNRSFLVGLVVGLAPGLCLVALVVFVEVNYREPVLQLCADAPCLVKVDAVKAMALRAYGTGNAEIASWGLRDFITILNESKADPSCYSGGDEKILDAHLFVAHSRILKLAKQAGQNARVEETLQGLQQLGATLGLPRNDLTPKRILELIEERDRREEIEA